MIQTRLAKYLAKAGLCSRRVAETWITAGRISVNGETILVPQFPVSDKDTILCDGREVGTPDITPRMWLYHKPRGLVTTHSDPEQRPTVFDNLPKNLPRLISVGRLDLNSEGLLLLTNSGPLARQLELPQNAFKRTYHIRVYGDFTKDMQRELKQGLTIEDVTYKPIHTKILTHDAKNLWIEFVLSEGKNREIRKVISHFGLKLNRLVRVAYGPYELGDLEMGKIREVEVDASIVGI